MFLIAAVDENMGIMFNGRRQSQDKVLREYILKESAKSILWMNSYTAKQFEVPLPDNVIVDDDCLSKAGMGELCFIEDLPVADYIKQIEKIILFKWNRVYPADTYFDVPLSENRWNLTSVLEFEGNSHEKITEEIWEVN